MSSIVWTIAPIWLPFAPRLVPTVAPVSTAFLLRAMPAAGANDDSHAADDGRGDDYDTSAGCSLGVVMPPTAACEARNVDYGGPAEHTAAKVFERCYGGQGNRAGPHHTT